jgi:hypothetical protein
MLYYTIEVLGKSMGNLMGDRLYFQVWECGSVLGMEKGIGYPIPSADYFLVETGAV